MARDESEAGVNAAVAIPPVRLGCHSLSALAVEEANDAWGFNCGPGALCAITGLSPEQLRPFLGDFEAKRYTNPTLMRESLNRLGIRYRWHVIQNQSASQNRELAMPPFGLARLQWGGPWCNPGVPMQARYRQTHWIATAIAKDADQCESRGVFDVNNNTDDHEVGWTDFESWRRVVVPELTRGYKRADGTWWVTHSVEVSRGCV